MIPSCIASSNQQSFAVPLRDEKRIWFNTKKAVKDKDGVILEKEITQADVDQNISNCLRPLGILTKVSQHLWAVTYGSACTIRGAAIVEEGLEDCTVWWLVPTYNTPTKECTSHQTPG